MRRLARVGWVVFALSLALMIAALVVWAVATGEPLTSDIVLYPVAYLAFGARPESITLWLRGGPQPAPDDGR